MAEPALRAPGPVALLGEAAWTRELVRLPLRARGLRGVPRGTGRPVVVISGLGGPEASTRPLRTFLRRVGHDARRSGLAVVGPDVEAQLERVGERVLALAARSDDQVGLVGWSIGGVIAREVARDHPGVVRRVVTFGTPAEGGPAHTTFGRAYGTAELERIADAAEERATRPISVPLTAIRSRRDGIVAPDACIDHRTPDAENLVVASTHIGMGLDPDVWRIVAERLARP